MSLRPAGLHSETKGGKGKKKEERKGGEERGRKKGREWENIWSSREKLMKYYEINIDRLKDNKNSFMTPNLLIFSISSILFYFDLFLCLSMSSQNIQFSPQRE